MKLWFSGLLAVAAVLQAAPPAPPAGEGRTWEKTTSSSFLLPDGSRLKVITDGTVRLQGGPGQGVSYRLRQRVTARSQAEADQMFRRFSVRTVRQGPWTVMVVSHGRGQTVDAELVVEVPRNLQASYCRNVSGPVWASDLDGPLQIESGGGRIDVDRLGSTLNAKTIGGEVRIGRVRGTINVISGAGPIFVDHASGESWLETAGGEIVVREIGAPLHASTAGGGVRVGRVNGNVSARTAGGRIEVDQATGWVVAENTAGPIQVGSARGVKCEAASGAIRLKGVSGAVQASTAMGSILAEIASGMRIENSFLNTGNGDITVFLPSNLAVMIQAQNESGNLARRIVSEFAEIQVRTLRLRPVQAEGTLNGGGPLLRLSAAGGTIYLRRLEGVR